MAVPKQYQDDLRAILARRHDQGADYWTTPDGRWGKGSPYSTFDCALLLTELGVARSDPLMKGVAKVLLDAWRDDGRFRPAPKAATYPCHTANAVRALCRLGYARDRRLARSFEYLLEAQHGDGGWRCNTVKLGRGPITDASNPGVTLHALDAFRFTKYRDEEPRLDRAVNSLLAHWKSRKPLGPCAFGIGTLFGKIEYPFLRYNLFYYVYVLSFYGSAKRRPAFRQALAALDKKLVDGRIPVENPNRGLAKLLFCRKGQPSHLATKRYREIQKNLAS